MKNEPSVYYIDNELHWARPLRNIEDLSLQASSQQSSTRSANNWNERGTSPDSPYSQVPASDTWA
jgi:hypothetical protein